MPIGGVIAGGLGAVGSIFGSSKAADAQAKAAAAALAFQREQAAIARKDLEPYRDAGTQAWGVLSQLLGLGTPQNSQFGSLLTPFTPQDLENSPGYQFTLEQGLKNLTNAGLTKGGQIGNLMRGGAEFVTGLAQNTYGNEFNRDLQTKKSIFDMLFQPTTLGSNAASKNATNAMALGQSGADTIMGAGNAQAAMWNSMGSTFNNAINNAAGSIGQYQMYKPLLDAQTNYFNSRGYGPQGTSGVTSPLNILPSIY